MWSDIEPQLLYQLSLQCYTEINNAVRGYCHIPQGETQFRSGLEFHSALTYIES